MSLCDQEYTFTNQNWLIIIGYHKLWQKNGANFNNTSITQDFKRCAHKYNHVIYQPPIISYGFISHNHDHISLIPWEDTLWPSTTLPYKPIRGWQRHPAGFSYLPSKASSALDFMKWKSFEYQKYCLSIHGSIFYGFTFTRRVYLRISEYVRTQETKKKIVFLDITCAFRNLVVLFIKKRGLTLLKFLLEKKLSKNP